jgi:hypothetical protein
MSIRWAVIVLLLTLAALLVLGVLLTLISFEF